MKRGLVLPLAAALGVAACLWFLDGERRRLRERAAVPAAPLVDPAALAPLAQGAPLAAPERSDLQNDMRVVARVGASARPPADARWLEVQVVLPDGVPADDEVWLLSRSTSRGYGPEWSRLRVGAGGDVRVPFPADATQGELWLESRYVFSETLEVDPSAESEPLVLSGELGAWVTGRVRLPSGSERSALRQEIRVELSVLAREGSAADQREALVADDLRFELLGVPAGRSFARVEAPRLVDHWDMSLVLEPGEHRVYDVALERGASVSGRVREPNGNGIADAAVVASARNAWMGFGDEDQLTQTDTGGAFTLDGLRAGTITLITSAHGYLGEKDLVLELADGEVVRDVELVLERGGEIAGRVQWPDGRPAAGARVSAAAQGSSPAAEAIAQAGPDGRFVIGGLAQGPFEVRALCPGDGGASEAEQAAPAEERARAGPEVALAREPAASVPVQSGRASLRNVAPGTDELLLALVLPLAVHGRVVDDRGAPVETFTVQATATSPLSSWPSVFESFHAPDGAFSLGLYPGEWRLCAESAHHARGKAAEATIAVPYHGDPLLLSLERPFEVAGLVLDPLGVPVPGALVLADPGSSSEADEEGRFLLSGCAPAGVMLQASGVGWAPSEEVYVRSSPGGDVRDVVLALRVGVTVTGEVYDQDGAPDTSARVTASSAGPMDGLDPDEGTPTDGSGRFQIEHLAPGRITVMAMPGEEELFARMASPESEGVADFLGALRMTTIHAQDGEEVHVVLGAEPRAPVRISGTLREDGEPLAGCQVVVFPEGGALMQGLKLASTDAHGRFALTLDRPGDYLFLVSVEGSSPREMPFSVHVPEAAEHHVALEIPLGAIAGRVLGPDLQPVAGIAVRLVSSAGGLRSLFVEQALRTATRDDGSFAFEHVSPGTYALQAGGAWLQQEELPEASRRYGATVVEGVVLAPDGRVQDLEIRLPHAGRVSGSVRDASGGPVPGATVFVRGAGGRLLVQVATDGGGGFECLGVPPERVSVFARKGERASVEVGPLDVAAGGEASAALVLQPGCTLVVSVLADERPVRADVLVLDAHGRRVSGAVTEEAMEALFLEGSPAGELRVGPLPAGRYQVRATARDGRSAERDVTLHEGRVEQPVTLRL